MGYIEEILEPVSCICSLLKFLAIKLREIQEYKGMERKGIKHLVTQIADDLSIFLKFKQEVMKAFDVNEQLTGMKISYEKTTTYRIGSILQCT